MVVIVNRNVRHVYLSSFMVDIISPFFSLQNEDFGGTSSKGMNFTDTLDTLLKKILLAYAFYVIYISINTFTMSHFNFFAYYRKATG